MDRIQNYICLSGPPTIRVSVLRSVPSATVAVEGPYQIVEVASQRVLRSGDYLPPTSVTGYERAFKIGTTTTNASVLRVIAADPGGVTLRDVRYRTEHASQISFRGELELRRTAGKIDVLNIVDLETYLAGVLGSEAPLRWPDEALRAQAIASRSYALYQVKMNKTKDYDVVATIGDQKYLGTRAELPKSRRICDETRGIVLFYDNHLFPTYFHSTCGGHTEEVSFLLDSRSIEPLKGVQCPYCDESKYFEEWTVRIKEQDIRSKLKAAGIKVGRIVDIAPTGEVGPGGRPRMLEIRHTGGTTKMKAYTFRLTVGSTKLLNTRFRTTKIGDMFEFRGNGYGHGIGMCQFGAMGQAKRGKSAVDILEYYYPGAELVRIY